MIGWCNMPFEEIVGLIPEIFSETVCPLLESAYDTVCDVVDFIKDCIEESFQDSFFYLAIESNTTYSSKKSYNKSKQPRKSKKSK